MPKLGFLKSWRTGKADNAERHEAELIGAIFAKVLPSQPPRIWPRWRVVRDFNLDGTKEVLLANIADERTSRRLSLAALLGSRDWVEVDTTQTEWD